MGVVVALMLGLGQWAQAADPFASRTQVAPAPLVGLVRVKEKGMAFFRVGERVRIVRIGEQIGEYRLIGIDDGGVELQRAGRRVRIRYGGENGR